MFLLLKFRTAVFFLPCHWVFNIFTNTFFQQSVESRKKKEFSSDLKRKWSLAGCRTGELCVQTVNSQFKWLWGRRVCLGSMDAMLCSNNSNFCCHMASSSQTGIPMTNGPINYLPDSNTNGFIITSSMSVSSALRSPSLSPSVGFSWILPLASCSPQISSSSSTNTLWLYWGIFFRQLYLTRAIFFLINANIDSL